MPWFKFSKDYAHKVGNTSVIDYKKDMHLNIPQDHVDEAAKLERGELTNHIAEKGDKKDGTQEVRLTPTQGGELEEDATPPKTTGRRGKAATEEAAAE